MSDQAIVVAEYSGLSDFLDAGDIAAATATVTKRHEANAPPSARVSMQLRHEAFKRARASAVPTHHEDQQIDWPPTSQRSWPEASGIPEIGVSELDLDSVVGGVRNHGALIVRGLFSESFATALRSEIDAELATGAGTGQAELADLAGQPVSPVFRENGRVFFDGQVATADVPVLAESVLAEFTATGLVDIVGYYLGERPALSLEKWTLRRVPPTTNSSWHQDGAFLGADVRTLNVWVALSDCGETAS